MCSSLLLQLNSELEPGIQECHHHIHHQVDQHHQGCNHDNDALHQWVVPLGNGFLQPVGDPRPGEDQLDQSRPR